MVYYKAGQASGQPIEAEYDTLDYAMLCAWHNYTRGSFKPIEIVDENDRRYGLDDMKRYWLEKKWEFKEVDANV